MSEFYDKFLIKVKEMESLPLCRSLGENDLVRFQERGGVVDDDNIDSIREFIIKYMVVTKEGIFRNVKYQKFFDALESFCCRFNCKSVIPRSFFLMTHVKMIMLMPSKEGHSIEIGIDDIEEEEEIDDFLGFFGDQCHKYDVQRDYTNYFCKIKQKFDIFYIIRKYRWWLKVNSVAVQVMKMTYETPYEFVGIFEKQFGNYYEVMSQFKKMNPDRSVRILSDGLGAMSMICIALNIPYQSNEMNGIGKVARGLGIITRKNDEFEDEEAVYVLANLSTYLDLKQFMSSNYIVIDENRLYEGCILKDMKISSQGRVFSNVMKGFDAFMTFNRPISQSLPMIRKSKNIPLDTKSEMYLLLNHLQVYTDGVVRTCTVSKICDIKDGLVRYILSTEKEDLVIDYTSNYLNIVTRGLPYSDYFKRGEVKVISGKKYNVVDDEVVVNHESDRYYIKKFILFNNPLELKNFFYSDQFIIGFSYTGKRKTFIRENDQKIVIVYLHSMQLNNYEYHVYQRKLDNNFLVRLINDIEEV